MVSRNAPAGLFYRFDPHLPLPCVEHLRHAIRQEHEDVASLHVNDLRRERLFRQDPQRHIVRVVFMNFPRSLAKVQQRRMTG